MKKIVLGVVLLLAAPALADVVIINVNDVGGGVVSIEYSVSDTNLVRAFAFDVNVDNNAVISSISDYFVGECNATKKGYGIFPGNIVIDSNGNVADYNKPVAPASAKDSPGQLGSSRITLEMGSLYVDTNNPATSGRLCKLKITKSGGGPNDCNLTIDEDATRGGVVMEDTGIAASTPNLPGTKKLNLDCLWVGRVFNSGLVVTQNMVNDWKLTGTGCVKKDPWWCCEAQKYGQAVGTTDRVNLADLTKVKLSWMLYDCDVGYYPAADFNLSGRVNLADLTKIKQNWMQYPGYCP